MSIYAGYTEEIQKGREDENEKRDSQIYFEDATNPKGVLLKKGNWILEKTLPILLQSTQRL